MQEIKYRAWDIEDKYMVYPNDHPKVNPQDCGKLIYCDMETVAIGLNGTLYLIDECGNYEYVNEFKKKGFILMGYTGLKDKHGQKIFAGDIVEGYNYKTNPEGGFVDDVIGVVKYEGMAFSIQGKQIKSKEKWFYTITSHKQQDKNIEIVGNIYEHKNLFDNK